MSGGLRAAFAAYLTWGLAPLYWRQIAALPAAQVTAHRIVHTVVLCVAVLWWREGRSKLRSLLPSRDVALRHLVAAVLLSGNWVVYVYAVATDRVVDASLGYYINPLLSVLLGLVVLGERFERGVWAALGLATAGVAVITLDAGRLPWISLVLASTFAVYGLVRKQSPLGAFEGLAVETGWVTPVALGLLVWWTMAGDLDLGPGATPAWLLLVGFATAVPLLFFGQATRTVPLWQIGMMQFLAPTIQFGLGAFVFGEEISAGRVGGFVLIWIGLGIFAADSVTRARRASSAARLSAVR